MAERTLLAMVLARRLGSSPGALEGVLRSEAGRLSEAGFAVTTGVMVEPDAFLGTAHGSEVTERIDGVLVAAPPPGWSLADSSAGLRGTAGALAAAVDPDRSSVIAGAEHVVLEGEAPLQINFALRRPPAMDHEEFSRYWLNVHGGLARDAPRRRSGGYRQLHADLAQSRNIAVACGFGGRTYDGMVTSGHHDVERMKKAFGHPSVSQVALDDERRFIDHSKSAIALIRKL